ncbi:MAG: metal-binding protein, partial [Croceibacterium sp.]
GEPLALREWPGAQCGRDFCVLGVPRSGKTWQLLMSRSRAPVEERALAAACERADIVVADRWLPRSCHPRWLLADERALAETGGQAIVLDGRRVTTVAGSQGAQGWWRPPSTIAAQTGARR